MSQLNLKEVYMVILMLQPVRPFPMDCVTKIARQETEDDRLITQKFYHIAEQFYFYRKIVA